MGNTTAQPNHARRGSTSNFTLNPIQGIYYHNEQDPYTKTRILESIKKGDLFLFQFIMQQKLIKPTELVGTIPERKTVLHCLAEYNFAVGMDLVLEHLYKVCPGEAPYILNSRDGAGNTCLIICCLHDAVETLKVLLKSDQVDATIKNSAGQTGLQIALEKESACSKILSVYLTKESSAKTGIKTLPDVSMTIMTTQSYITPYKRDDENSSPLIYHGPPTSLITMDSFNHSEARKTLPSSRLNSVIENLKGASLCFIDEEFPHDNPSLTGDNYLSEHFNGSNIIKWARPQEFVGGNIKLFDKLQVNDVSSSPIAGCDLYAVFAIMTEFPQRLVKVFTTKEVNTCGAYSINFLVCGVLVEIMLDDYFPCFQSSNQLAFSRIKSNELWFSLLEKAAAKLYGSYAEADSIGIVEAFEMITGMPSAQHNFEDYTENELWNMLTDFYQRNYLVCVGYYQDQNFTRSCHVSLVGVYKANGIKVVKLKLQYETGEEYWKYYDRSKKWTKQFKEAVSYFEHEKDCFYMEIAELKEQFDFISVCYYHDNWVRNRMDVQSSSKETVFFEFILEKPTEIFISVHQKLPSFVDEGPEYRISPVEIALAQDLGNEVRSFANGCKEPVIESTTHISDKIRLNLPEGKYIVRTRVRWLDGQDHAFSISTLAPSPVILRKVNAELYPNFLERIYTDLALRSKQKFNFNNDCRFVSGLNGTDLWLCAINDGDKVWELEVIFEMREGLKIKKKYKATDNSLKFRVLPGAKEVGLIKRLTRGIVGLKWKLVHSWEATIDPFMMDWERLKKRVSVAESNLESFRGIEIE